MSVKEKVYAQKEKFKQLAGEGATRKQLAEALNVSISSIDKYAKELGIQLKLQKIVSDLSGQSFDISHLDVIERDFNPPFQSHETAYRCKCQLCGKITTFRKSNIINGPGCHSCSKVKGGRGYREWSIGDQFGYLTVIGKGERSGYVKCKCICGVIKDISLKHLKGQGHSRTISCGCKQVSSGELKISQILNENNIEYISQYKIPELSSFMSFDFAILDSNKEIIKLIEFDGQQHFEAVDRFGGEEQLAVQKERDGRKDKWCKEHGIELQRVPYWDFDKIDIDYLNLRNLK